MKTEKCFITVHEENSFWSSKMGVINTQGKSFGREHEENSNVCCCYFCLVGKLFLTDSWTVAHESHLSMGFPRQEY